MTRLIALLPAACPGCGNQHVPLQADAPCGACASSRPGSLGMTPAQVLARRVMTERQA